MCAAAISATTLVGSPSTAAAGQLPEVQPYQAFGYGWQPVRLGGGGNTSGLDGADDGTLVARSDVYGAYVRGPGDDMWRQLITPESMPEEWHLPKMGKGVFEVAIAPGDASRIYLMWAGHLFASDDGGATFIQTDFEASNWDANARFARGFGDRMAVDPQNPDVVLAGAPNTALRVSTDGGQTFEDTEVPAGRPAPVLDDSTNHEIKSVGITGVAFDRTSPATDDDRTSIVYAASWGRGVYRSLDGGDSWEPIGGPVNVHHAAVAGDGAYYVSSGDRNGPFSIQRFDGAWTDITPPSWNPRQIAEVENPFLAASPSDPDTVVVGYAQQMFLTRDRGLTWTPMTWKDAPGDVTWADAQGVENYYLVASDLVFDRADPARMWLATGEGAQVAELTAASAALTWTERSRGIESMVATAVTSTRNSAPVFAVHDFGQFGGTKTFQDFSAYKGPVPFFAGTTSISASPFSTGFAVSATTDYVQHGKYPVFGSYTLNGGKSWRQFPTMPKNATSAAEFGYGAIAASTSSNILWAPGRYYPTTTTDFQPYYTKNRGRTWKPVKLPGVTSYPADTIGGFMFGQNRQTIAADQVRRGVFYLYMRNEGLYRTVNGGDRWTLMHEGDITLGDPSAAGSLAAMPGEQGTLFYTDGAIGGHNWQGAQQYGGYPFIRSDDGGATWTAVGGVDSVLAFGFGAAPKGSRVATIYLAGSVDDEYGIWRSTDNAETWEMIADYPGTLDTVTSISGDMKTFGLVYVGFGGSSFVYGMPMDATQAPAATVPTTLTTAPTTTPSTSTATPITPPTTMLAPPTASPSPVTAATTQPGSTDQPELTCVPGPA